MPADDGREPTRRSETASLVASRASHTRLDLAARWLAERGAATPVTIVGANRQAADHLARLASRDGGAAFGWMRSTLVGLAVELALPTLAESNRSPLTALAAEALVARVLHELGEGGDLGVYERVHGGPGLARALAATVGEVRLAGLGVEDLGAVAPDLAAILDRYLGLLSELGFADRADILSTAVDVAAGAIASSWNFEAPLLLLDVRPTNRLEQDLVATLLDRAPEALCTAPDSDRLAESRLGAAFPAGAVQVLARQPENALQSLQESLFGRSENEARGGDESVIVLSAPGEARECVEIARRLHQLAARGVRFDETAIALRAPEEYLAHLEEALGRAGIPAYFARSSSRPHPAGRALVALLDCAFEGLSARRFAEYLSLGQVPAEGEQAQPLAALSSELLPRVLQREGAVEEADDGAVDRPSDQRVIAGTVRSPRRWERMLSDAAVIGGFDRWQRRLDAAEGNLLDEVGRLEDPDDPARERLLADLDALRELRRFALPILGQLESWPAQSTWAEWLVRLRELTQVALRRPDSVLEVLAELQPMGEVGPVDLGEVRQVLSARLLSAVAPPPRSPYGRVLVAPIEALRGRSFEVVFVPGLAERLFPRKISEDPILLDGARRRIGGGLETNDDRLADERLLLQLAVGAARSSVVLSYPRLDLAQGRPRVPSFYALEALRAAEGRMPSFDELSSRAEREAGARVGWPAPARPEDAIDEAEHDLALLENLRSREDSEKVGTARFLLEANPHLGRALRFRARRWLKGWTPADGLVRPSAPALEVIRRHQLDQRSYSPTALEKYAACPYQFFLYAVQRLSPREVAEVVDDLDPLRRGSLVHETQFALFEELRERGLLPVVPGNLGAARDILDSCLDREASRLRDQLLPRIERVWLDAVESIRADLREWLRRMSVDPSGYVPWRFELAFGLRDRGGRDESSVEEPIKLDCGIRLRGSIDLVERRDDGHLRATDHKTGRARMPARGVVAGGRSLQPVLYALALEGMYPDDTVDGGRLYYCTSAGAFEEREIALDGSARKSAADLARVVGESLEIPFLPARPERGACEWCDYRVICGPYEEIRTGRKTRKGTEGLDYLRSLP